MTYNVKIEKFVQKKLEGESYDDAVRTSMSPYLIAYVKIWLLFPSKHDQVIQCTHIQCTQASFGMLICKYRDPKNSETE